MKVNRVPEVIRRAEARVPGLVQAVREDPARVEDFARLSAEAQGQFRDFVAGLPSLEDARRAALQALSAGLMCGALEGVLLMEASREPEAAVVPPAASSELQGQLRKLDEALSQGRTVARESWAGMSADELQLLSGFGKHQNLRTEEEAAEVAARGSLAEVQTFLLGTFKAGYAMGLVDAVLVSVTGERPGQPPA